MSSREPLLEPVAILDLRPTQMTVGMREVVEKRRRWQQAHGKKQQKFLGSHMIPVVQGPKNRFYVVDHHHLARALHDEGQKNVLVTVIADLSSLQGLEFWTFCDHRGWVYPYDSGGARRGFDDVPKDITGLKDDPYRSLAGELRRAGGFAKDTTPFSEFLWASFLRSRVKAKLIQNDFDKAIEHALIFARGREAAYLPGWCGPSDG